MMVPLFWDYWKLNILLLSKLEILRKSWKFIKYFIFSRVLCELAQLQDEEVGDGTTSVVILAAELLKVKKKKN